MALPPLAPGRGASSASASASASALWVRHLPFSQLAFRPRSLSLWSCARRVRHTVYVHNSSSNSYDHDDEYVQAHVLEAVSMVPAHGQLFMTLANGKEVKVHHVNPVQGRLLYKSSTPAIFLKIEHEHDLMLPIVVGEVAVSMLLKALHEEDHGGRPNYYQLLRATVDALNHEVRKVRVTERVDDTYHARIDVGKPGDSTVVSVDARPSDAINVAVRCKVPILVKKSIVAADAVKPVVDSSYNVLRLTSWDKEPSLDSADSEPDPVAEEITLMKSMLLAVVEERYADAARCRDELRRFRTTWGFKRQSWQI
eukprot:TRINITY_DN1257_c0_g2_i1.p1 TRINITY_DN1257_c0_g2~~TRINITY_DN1257_c0_g2_i1.p1  ORF type:complete len:311 (+),score=22.79 TRINITY_DN1257_c0_g2_i1:270-1202(+)